MNEPTAASGLDAIRAVFENLPPAPKVDRVVVHDDRALSMFERCEQPTSARFDSILPAFPAAALRLP